jgi:drug/metabolite transporter (DMT)-like permease
MCQCLLIKAFQIEKSSFVALLLNTNIVFSFVVDIVVFNTSFTVLTIIGSIVITSSAIGVPLYKKKLHKEEEDRKKMEG